MASRILIAEDHPQLAASLTEFLTRRGLAVERAADGAEALGRIARNPPDLLLLDLKLPRLHGVELLRKLRQSPRTRKLPVVVMTGVYRGEQFARAARSLGVSGWLEKPFKAAELLAVLERSLPAIAPLDVHLGKAFLGRFSGRLLLRRAEQEYSLTFISGTPVFLRPGFAFRDFGDWLRQRGFLSADEYAWYAGPGQLRHELPVQMGCIEYPRLLEEKLAYLSAELVAAFALPPFIAEEHPQAPPAGMQLLTINVPEIFRQGYRQHQRQGARERLLAEKGALYAALAPDYYRFINFLSLSPGEKQLLRRLDGTRPLAKCLAGEEDLVPLAMTFGALGMLRCAANPLPLPPPPDFPLRQLFNAAAEETATVVETPLESFADLLDQAEAPATVPSLSPPPATLQPEDGLAEQIRSTCAELQGKNHYEVFGITQAQFSFELLRERYFALTRRFGPEALMRLGGPEARLAEEILDTVTTAYKTLSDVVMKENYDQLLGSDRIGLGQRGDERFQAQVQAQSGKVFIEMGEWENAEKALQDACNIEPENGDFLAHLAWAIYRNPKTAASSAVREKARQLLNRALALERTVDGFAFKGWMLLEGGQDALAAGEFSKALRLDARHALARKGLRKLQEKQEQERKGLFRRIFG